MKDKNNPRIKQLEMLIESKLALFESINNVEKQTEIYKDINIIVLKLENEKSRQKRRRSSAVDVCDLNNTRIIQNTNTFKEGWRVNK